MARPGKCVLVLAADLFEDMELLYPLYRLGDEAVAVTAGGSNRARNREVSCLNSLN